MSQWQLAGNAAELYEQWAVPYVLGPWVPGLLDLAALRSGERVLESSFPRRPTSPPLAGSASGRRAHQVYSERDQP
jgi:hypothetical protein